MGMPGTNPVHAPHHRVPASFAALLLLVALMLPVGTAEAQRANPGRPPERGAAADQGQSALRDFAGCIAGASAASVLIVMDESASLVGFGDEEATDPEALRVAAAKDFAGRMARYAERSGAEVDVALAGFADGYVRRGDFTPLGVDGEGSTLDGEIERFADRADGSYTNYEEGLDGAFAEFDGVADECRAVLFFSDGKPTSSSWGSPMDPVCAEGGPVARLRAGGVRLFTIGLGAETDADLRRISEGECSAQPADGAHLPAADAAGLFAAFRAMIPGGAGQAREGVPLEEAYEFTLDDTVAPVELSAQPAGRVPVDELVPVLTPPGGEPTTLTEGESEIGGARVSVTGNPALPGMVDVSMERAGEDFAGRWAFGYRRAGDAADADTYRVSMAIVPGLRIDLPGSPEQGPLSLSTGDRLPVRLLGPDGKPRSFAGDARLRAELVPADGSDPVPLAADLDIRSGAAEVPLDAVTGRLAGTLRLAATITTAAGDDAPGTELSPLTFERAASIAAPTTPKLPGSVTLELRGGSGSAEIPVTGPGKAWVADGEFAVGDETVAYTADHDAGDPLELAPGETGVIRIDAEVDDPVDRTFDGAVLPVTVVDAESGAEENVDVPVRGSMSAPVDKAAFGLALVLALLLALLIPAAVLYLMKYLVGRIPARPGVLGLRIPVRLDGDRLVRVDRGGEFDIDHAEVLAAPRTVSTGRAIDVAGIRVAVQVGWNPVTPPRAVAGATPSISDDGRRRGGAAELPPAVQDRWFVLGGEEDPDSATVVLALDEAVTRDRLERIADAVRRDGPARVRALAEEAAPPAAPEAGRIPSADGATAPAADPAGWGAGGDPAGGYGAAPFGGGAPGHGAGAAGGGPGGTGTGGPSFGGGSFGGTDGPVFGDGGYGYDPGSGPDRR